MNISIGPKLPLNVDKKNGFISIDNYADEAKQNLKILILTNPGERIFDSNFGVGLRNFLFENPDSDVEEIITNRIRAQISAYLPYILINDVKVYRNDEYENLLYVLIDFFIKPLGLKQQLTLSFAE
jgi:phage baseplate assembly protein W